MSVLIKGIEMPTNCWFCPVNAWDDDEYVCPFSGRTVKSGDVNRHDDCPLIPIPDHGDLIDREALMSEIADWQLTESPEEGRNWWLGKDVTSHEMQYCIYRLLGDVYEEVRDIPVVIPAERREDGET